MKQVTRKLARAVFKCIRTGKFVSEAYARNNPKTTFLDTSKVRTHK
jgi:hypothetical protein